MLVQKRNLSSFGNLGSFRKTRSTPLSRAKACDDRVFQPFIEKYASYVCNNEVECLQKAIIPIFEKQIEIISTMENITKDVDITPVASTVFKLLILDNEAKLALLINLLHVYYESVGRIRDIVESTNQTF